MSTHRRTASWRYRCPEGHVCTRARRTMSGWYCTTCERVYGRLKDGKTGEWVADHTGPLVWIHPNVADGRTVDGERVYHDTRRCPNSSARYEKVPEESLTDIRLCGRCRMRRKRMGDRA